jgi:hypothetical protein
MPARWNVRTGSPRRRKAIAWLNRCRRLPKDWEELGEGNAVNAPNPTRPQDIRGPECGAVPQPCSSSSNPTSIICFNGNRAANCVPGPCIALLECLSYSTT